MGQIRTPPSLKWLIDKRARLLGEITKREHTNNKVIESAETALEQAKYRLTYERSVKPRILSALREELAAIDIALGLHEVKIDPDIIPEVRTQDDPRKLPYGDITRTIFECLKLAGNIPISTTDISMFVAIKNDVDTPGEAFRALRKSVASRLKNLRLDGKVERVTAERFVLDPTWKLK